MSRYEVNESVRKVFRAGNLLVEVIMRREGWEDPGYIGRPEDSYPPESEVEETFVSMRVKLEDKNNQFQWLDATYFLDIGKRLTEGETMEMEAYAKIISLSLYNLCRSLWERQVPHYPEIYHTFTEVK